MIRLDQDNATTNEKMLLVLMVVVGLTIETLVFKLGWCWFVAEPFGIAELSMFHAFGLLVLLVASGLVKILDNKMPHLEKVEYVRRSFSTTVTTAAYLYITHLCM